MTLDYLIGWYIFWNGAAYILSVLISGVVGLFSRFKAGFVHVVVNNDGSNLRDK